MGRRYSVEAALAEKEARYKQKMNEGRQNVSWEFSKRNRYGTKIDRSGKYSRVVLLIDTQLRLNSIRLIEDTLVIFSSASTVTDLRKYFGKYNDYCVQGDITEKAALVLAQNRVPENIKGKVEDVEDVKISEINIKRKRGRKAKGCSGGDA